MQLPPHSGAGTAALLHGGRGDADTAAGGPGNPAGGLGEPPQPAGPQDGPDRSHSPGTTVLLTQDHLTLVFNREMVQGPDFSFLLLIVFSLYCNSPTFSFPLNNISLVTL